MTAIISSQRYLDWNIVEAKIALLQGVESLVLEAWDVKAYDCAVLYNGHHTLAAARELNIPVSFVVVDHPEGIEGDNLLEQAWMDSDWYNVETDQLVF